MSNKRKLTKSQKLTGKLWKRMVIAHTILDVVEEDSTILPPPFQRRINALAHALDDWAKATEQAINHIEEGSNGGN